MARASRQTGASRGDLHAIVIKNPLDVWAAVAKTLPQAGAGADGRAGICRVALRHGGAFAYGATDTVRYIACDGRASAFISGRAKAGRGSRSCRRHSSAIRYGRDGARRRGLRVCDVLDASRGGIILGGEVHLHAAKARARLKRTCNDSSQNPTNLVFVRARARRYNARGQRTRRRRRTHVQDFAFRLEEQPRSCFAAATALLEPTSRLEIVSRRWRRWSIHQMARDDAARDPEKKISRRCVSLNGRAPSAPEALMYI